MIELGVKAKDLVTGFKGIVTARVQYLTGCDQYCIVPTASNGSELKEGVYFDENRIKVLAGGKKMIEIKNLENGETGGSQMDTPSKII